MKKVISKIKFFFDTLVKSLTKFEYYKEISKAKFKFSLKYLFFLFYLLSLIGSLMFSGSIAALILPKVPLFINSFESKADSLYPKGLVITIKEGLVATNQKEPYFIDTLDQFGLNHGQSHFITIDTNANAGNIKDENTAVLITKDSVVTLDSNSSYRVYPIDKTINTTINQSLYNKLISQILPYLKYVEPGLVILLVLSILLLPFVSATFLLLSQLIYLLIFSLIFFILVKIMKKTLTFKKLYQLTMHASTLPILLGLVVSTIGIQMPFLLGSAILFVFMILVVNNLP